MRKQILTRIGAKLANFRESKGFTQESLEEASGVPRRTIQNIEHGATEDPGLGTVLKLLGAMNGDLKDIGVQVIRNEATQLREFRALIENPGSVPTLELANLLSARFVGAPEKMRAAVLYFLTGNKTLVQPYLEELAKLLPSPNKK